MSESTNGADAQGDRLERLLMLHVEGDLDDAGHAVLADMLHDDVDAQQRYLDYTSMHALLEWEQPEILSGERFFKLNRVSRFRRTWLTVYDVASNYITLSLLISAIVMSIIVLSMNLIVPDWNLGGPVGPDTRFVAEITDIHQASFDKSSNGNSKNRSLFVDDQIVLNGGLAVVTHNSGARVVLEGPAIYQIKGSKIGYFSLGKLVARVEDERAKGFTVDTPHAQVVDLGTEFAVEVDRNGTSEIYVRKGKVRVATTADPASSVTINAGQAARCEARVDQVVSIEFVSDKFSPLALIGRETIPIINHSFEIPEGNNFDSPPTGWTGGAESGTPQVNQFGNWAPSAPPYHVRPAARSGRHFLLINHSVAESTKRAMVFQDTTTSFKPGHQYTLIVDVMRRSDESRLPPTAWGIALAWDDGTFVAEQTGELVGGEREGVLSEARLTYTATKTDADRTIRVVLFHNGENSQVNFDNVRLASSLASVPSALSGHVPEDVISLPKP